MEVLLDKLISDWKVVERRQAHVGEGGPDEV
jgi:hypothetical protein